MVLPPEGTLLVIRGMGVPLFSARGLTQTLTPISQANQVTRDINGTAMNMSQPQFQKYATKISCNDFRVPAVDGVWPGMEFEIECVSELCHHIYAARGRDAVEGSEWQDGEFIHYRPLLSVVFLGFDTNTPEWDARVAWAMDFEEV